MILKTIAHQRPWDLHVPTRTVHVCTLHVAYIHTCTCRNIIYLEKI